MAAANESLTSGTGSDFASKFGEAMSKAGILIKSCELSSLGVRWWASTSKVKLGIVVESWIVTTWETVGVKAGDVEPM